MKMNKRMRIMRYRDNKLVGGVVNQRGNDYELCYAIYKIMLSADKFATQSSSVAFSTQVKAYIDDFYVQNLIAGEIEESYYQLKTSVRLSWGKAAKIGSLSFDFKSQKELLLQRNVKFQLALVVAVAKVGDSLQKRRPALLNKCCIVEIFPWAGSITQQLVSFPAFKGIAERLCAFKDPDKLVSLVSHFVGAWAMSNKQNVSLDQILQLVRSRGLAFLKASLHPPLDSNVAVTLDRIPGFRYQIVNGYLAWNFSTSDQGYIPHVLGSVEFRNIEKEILLKRPATFTDIETIIS